MSDGDNRKLATILALDVAGYSAASEKNQERAIALVQTLRERAATLAAAEGGNIFNTAGDGIMLEFPLASGAVRAALTLVREAFSDPERLPPIHAGIHLAEVVLDGNDRLGHGVNVAARLMQMASANALVISDTVKDQLRGEISAEFVPRGRVRLKKMNEIVFAFEYVPVDNSVRRQWLRWRRPASLAAASIAVLATLVFVAAKMFSTESDPAGGADTPFVAVLPFENVSGDPKLAYFSDGISTEIQATLAQYQQGLRVAGLSTGFRFRGSDKDPANVRGQMGATHIVDGSVRREGANVRIVAELIDARSAAVIWTQTYDRALTQTLEAQGDIARQVGHLLHAAAPEVGAPPSQIPPAALERYLHAVSLLQDTDSTVRVADAVQDLEQATADAPQFARAWALLSQAYTAQSRRRNEDEQAALIARARAVAQKALALDPHLALAEAMLGRLEPEWSWDKRTRHYQRALALAPNDVRSLGYWASFLSRMGRARDQARVEEQILRLDPLSEQAQGASLDRLLEAHDVAGAIRVIERLIAQNEGAAIQWMRILNDRVKLGDVPGAQQALRELEKHQAAIARDRAWSPETAAHFWDTERREVDALAHHSLTAASTRQIGQQIYDHWTSNGGQGCVVDHIADVASHDRPDLAWRMVETLYVERGYVATTDSCPRPVYPERQASTTPLFEQALLKMRYDQRIWTVFDAVGLTRYWIESNQWPDFCSDPHLPYNCRSVATLKR